MAEKEQLRCRLADLNAAIAMQKLEASNGKVTGDGRLKIDTNALEVATALSIFCLLTRNGTRNPDFAPPLLMTG